MQKTALLRSLQQHGSLEFLAQIPALSAVSDALALRFAEEIWNDDDDEVEVTGYASATRERFEWAGLALNIGRPGPQAMHLPFSMLMPTAAVQALFAIAAKQAGLAPHLDVDLDVLADGLSDFGGFTLRFGQDLAAIELEIGPVPISIDLSNEWMKRARHVHDQSGAIIGVELDPAAPDVSIALGEASIRGSGSGLSIDFDQSEALDLPPVMLADTGLAIELKDLVLRLSDGPLPPEMSGFAAEHAITSTWRGLYAKTVALWNLDRVLPGGPAGRAGDVGGSRIEADGLAIGASGITGTVKWIGATPQGSRFSLDEFALAFSQSWYPLGIGGKGTLDLSADGAGQFGYVAALEIEPFAAVGDRWRLDLRFADSGNAEEPLAAIENPPPSLAAGLAAASAALGSSDAALVLAALGTGIRTGILSCSRASLDGAKISGRLRTDGFALSAELDMQAEISVDALSRPVPLALGSHLHLLYDPATGFSSSWTLADGFKLLLSTTIDIAGPVSLERVGVFRRDDGMLVIEFGIDMDGSGDAAIGGLPDVLVLVYDPVADRFLPPELKRSQQAFTLLVPGTIYASGTLNRSSEQFPQLGTLTWGDALTASLTVHLVGNGTATTPADHLKKESYLYSLDLGLLTATREDGLKALVVTGDLSFEPGLPLGTTGAALYGIGLTYAQNAEPSAQDGDYTGWFLRESPQFSTIATKWQPQGGAFGFGAAVTIGSAPDSGRSWNVAAGLFVLVPGPVILVTGKGSLFSPPPQLPEGGSGTSVDAPFAAAIALDFLRDRFTAELTADLEIGAGGRNILELNIPARIDASLGAPVDLELSIGRYRPADARVRGRALELYDIGFYLMATTRGIDDFPRDNSRLSPFAVAYGGSGGLSAGFSSSLATLMISVEAGFDLGVSLANPPLLAGRIYIDGTLEARVVGIGFEFGIQSELIAIAPDPFEVSGSIALRFNLPWPLKDKTFTGSFRLGTEASWPADYPWPTDPIADISLFPRPNGTSKLSDGSSIDARSLAASAVVTGVPVDAGILLSFRAPVGNASPQIGLTETQADDRSAQVWEIASDAEGEDGRPLQIGWRHELVKVELREAGQVVPMRGGWSFQAAAGNLAATGTAAPGGQADRRRLHLMAPLESPVERRFGTGLEVITEMVEGWQPCAVPRDAKSGRNAYTVPWLDAERTGMRENPVMRESVWYFLDRHGTNHAGDVRLRYQSQRPGILQSVPAHETTAPIVLRCPRDRDFRAASPLDRPDNVLALPTALFALARDRDRSLEASTRLAMIPGHVEIDFPDTTTRRDVFVLLRDGATLDIRAKDGPAITASLVHNSTIALADGDVWNVHRAILAPGTRAISLCALAVRSESGALFGPLQAMLLGCEVFAETLDTVQDAARRRSAAQSVVTGVGADSADWASGGSQGLLKPDTLYELQIEVVSRHARKHNGGSLTLGQTSKSFAKTVSFRTEKDIEGRLAARQQAASWAGDIAPEWAIDTAPGADALHYRGHEMTVVFSDSVTAGRIAAHGREIVLDTLHENGTRTSDIAAQLVAEAKREHSALQDALAEYIEGQPCLATADPLWLSLTAKFNTVLAPGRYQAQLLARDKTGMGRPDSILHEWRFVASHYIDLAEHCAAHDIKVRPLRGQAVDAGARLKQILGKHTLWRADDVFEEAWLDGLGLPPMGPSYSPSATAILHEDGASAFVFDGVEPVFRPGVNVELRQSGSAVPLNGVVTNSAGTRAIVCAASPVASGACELVIGSGAVTASLVMDIAQFTSFEARL